MSIKQPKPLFGSCYDNTDINSLSNEECQPLFNPTSGNILLNNNNPLKPEKKEIICHSNDFQRLDPVEYGINSSAYASSKQFCLAYTIKQTIGKGNFSVVKLATHTVTGQHVAIKIIEKNKLSSENLEKVYREIKVMKKLNHKNIVNLYQIFDAKNLIYIIMEYVPHGELFDFINKYGPINEKMSSTIFLAILSAVEHCHINNVVHRDLKAENLLLDDKMNIKLADFGFSTFNSCLNEKHSTEKLLLTWCGSPPYAAPEIFKGDPYKGTKADIWSLGVVLYVMVCGNLPFDGQTLPELKNQVIRGKFQIPFWLSHECEHLIKWMLSKNPTRRPSINDIRTHSWFSIMKKSHSNDENLSNIKTSNSTSSVKLMSTSVQNSLSNSSSVNSGHDSSENSSTKDSQDSSNSNDLRDDFRDGKFNDVALDIMDSNGISKSKVLDSLKSRCYDHVTAIYLLLCEKIKNLDHLPQNGSSNLLTTGQILSTLSLNNSPKSNYTFIKSHTPIITETSTTSLDYKKTLTPINGITTRSPNRLAHDRRRPLSQVAPKSSRNERLIKIHGMSIKNEENRIERTITPEILQKKPIVDGNKLFLHQMSKHKITNDDSAYLSMRTGKKSYIPLSRTPQSRLSPYENGSSKEDENNSSPVALNAENNVYLNGNKDLDMKNGYIKSSKLPKSPTTDERQLKPFTTIKTIPQWVVRGQNQPSSRKMYISQNHLSPVYSTSTANGNGPVIIVNAGSPQNYFTTQS